jgi:hypothetical protein
MSAKYGLVLPGKVVEPYDRCIQDLKPDERHALAQEMNAQFGNIDPMRVSQLTSLCRPEYNEVLEMAHIQPGQAPFASLAKEEKHAQLQSLTDPRATEGTLNDAYTIIEKLIAKTRIAEFAGCNSEGHAVRRYISVF